MTAPSSPRVLWFVLALLSACKEKADCEPEYREGEQFKLIVVERTATSGDCGIAPLAVGDSFVLTAGALLEEADLCKVRGAAPQIPEFAKTVLTSCRERSEQLGLSCSGKTSAGCDVLVQTSVGPSITSSTTVIEDGLFSLAWSGNTCLTTGCSEVYRVRIERQSSP